ncbi:MAG TPA: L-histidine N(alpha)-methyltransferase [Dissulfurispiraceae bacterium]
MIAARNVEIVNFINGSFQHEMKADILEGMTAPRKYIPSKYFYDARGSRLFEEICRLPEYYLTRTELSILENSASDIMRHFRGGTLVELGSGACRKIRMLLGGVRGTDLGNIRYMPVDVSESALAGASEELLAAYPGLRMRCVVADFTRHIGSIPSEGGKWFVLFGSTIGNLSCSESEAFLRVLAGVMGPDDRFLLGVDMVKARDVLEPAYNDAQGVTAEFNKNILAVLNRELDACFDPGCFDHVAFYNSPIEQVEMHLRANRGVSVEIGGLGLRVEMRKGETIRTEICRKFTAAGIERMAGDSGLKITRRFHDPGEWFCLVELAVKDP